MFDKSADLYDLLYSQFKDYAVEVAQIHQLISKHHPNAKALLDVGCGTGEHAHRLTQKYSYHVDGIDIEPDFVALSRQKNVAGTFSVADMKDFQLAQRYDVILCLFSSIGYVGSIANLNMALHSFSRHLKPDGLLIVEPWFEPGVMTNSTVYLHTAETDEVKVCRMSHTDIVGKTSILRFEYLVGQADGITSFQERHEMGLFTQSEMMHSFQKAGLTVTYEASGLSGRGIYIGRKVGA